MMESIAVIVGIVIIAAYISWEGRRINRGGPPWNHRGDGTDRFTQHGRIRRG
jgi:hypothetical protein